MSRHTVSSSVETVRIAEFLELLITLCKYKWRKGATLTRIIILAGDILLLSCVAVDAQPYVSSHGRYDYPPMVFVVASKL